MLKNLEKLMRARFRFITEGRTTYAYYALNNGGDIQFECRKSASPVSMLKKLDPEFYAMAINELK